jgi:plastocyanin
VSARTSLAGLILVALALPGCGSEKSGFASVPGGAEPEFKGPARSDVRIEMREIEYKPRKVKLAKGATVTWVNRDRVAHTVTKGSIVYHDFTSGQIEPGGSYRRTFDEPGEVRYRCTIHANMEGVFRVE